jgi:hypothetical protein
MNTHQESKFRHEASHTTVAAGNRDPPHKDPPSPALISSPEKIDFETLLAGGEFNWSKVRPRIKRYGFQNFFERA